MRNGFEIWNVTMTMTGSSTVYETRFTYYTDECPIPIKTWRDAVKAMKCFGLSAEYSMHRLGIDTKQTRV